MQKIIEMNWYGLAPGSEPQGEPDACYEMTETPNGDLIQGGPCEAPREADIVSASWSQDRELNGMVNHTRLVRVEVGYPHDPAHGRCCPCDKCDAERLLSLAGLRYDSAAQAALWQPGNKKLATAWVEARADLEEAHKRLLAISGAGRKDSQIGK